MKPKTTTLLIPGWVCDPKTDGWGPWLIEKLTENNFKVITQRIPHILKLIPRRRRAVREFKSLLSTELSETIIIAHSFGAAVALKLISELKQPIGGLILISPLYRWPFRKWLVLWRNPVDLEKVRQNCPNIRIIHSEDDYLVPFCNGKILAERLKASLTTFCDKGHFAPRDGCFEFPEVLEIALALKNFP